MDRIDLSLLTEQFLQELRPQVRDSHAGASIASGLRKLYTCIVCGTLYDRETNTSLTVNMKCPPLLINRLISELFFVLVAPSSCFLPSVRILAASLVCHLAPDGRIPTIFQDAFLDNGRNNSQKNNSQQGGPGPGAGNNNMNMMNLNQYQNHQNVLITNNQQSNSINDSNGITGSNNQQLHNGFGTSCEKSGSSYCPPILNQNTIINDSTITGMEFFLKMSLCALTPISQNLKAENGSVLKQLLLSAERNQQMQEQRNLQQQQQLNQNYQQQQQAHLNQQQQLYQTCSQNKNQGNIDHNDRIRGPGQDSNDKNRGAVASSGNNGQGMIDRSDTQQLNSNNSSAQRDNNIKKGQNPNITGNHDINSKNNFNNNSQQGLQSQSDPSGSNLGLNSKSGINDNTGNLSIQQIDIPQPSWKRFLLLNPTQNRVCELNLENLVTWFLGFNCFQSQSQSMMSYQQQSRNVTTVLSLQRRVQWMHLLLETSIEVLESRKKFMLEADKDGGVTESQKQQENTNLNNHVNNQQNLQNVQGHQIHHHGPGNGNYTNSSFNQNGNQSQMNQFHINQSDQYHHGLVIPGQDTRASLATAFGGSGRSAQGQRQFQNDQQSIQVQDLLQSSGNVSVSLRMNALYTLLNFLTRQSMGSHRALESEILATQQNTMATLNQSLQNQQQVQQDSNFNLNQDSSSTENATNNLQQSGPSSNASQPNQEKDKSDSSNSSSMNPNVSDQKFNFVSQSEIRLALSDSGQPPNNGQIYQQTSLYSRHTPDSFYHIIIQPVEAFFSYVLTQACTKTKKPKVKKYFLPVSLNFFSASSDYRQVLEPDCTPCAPGNSFSALNNALEYSDDQCLNIAIFSCLYEWLYNVYHMGTITRVDVHSSGSIIGMNGLNVDNINQSQSQQQSNQNQMHNAGSNMQNSAGNKGSTQSAQVITNNTTGPTKNINSNINQSQSDQQSQQSGNKAQQQQVNHMNRNQIQPQQRRILGFCCFESFPLSQQFREAIVSYCHRILAQSEMGIVFGNGNSSTGGQRSGSSSSSMSSRSGNSMSASAEQLKNQTLNLDVFWQSEMAEATSSEAVRILDLLCIMDASLVSCIFPAIKKVYERTCVRNSNSNINSRNGHGYGSNSLYNGGQQQQGCCGEAQLFCAVLQFMLNHAHHVIFDVEPVLTQFFHFVASRRHHKTHLLAMSTVLFLIQNRDTLLKQTNVFSKYFPVILKLLVWHPRIMSQEILSLLPSMVSAGSMRGLFHQLLDLPLTAAFMEDDFLYHLDMFEAEFDGQQGSNLSHHHHGIGQHGSHHHGHHGHSLSSSQGLYMPGSDNTDHLEQLNCPQHIRLGPRGVSSAQGPVSNSQHDNHTMLKGHHIGSSRESMLLGSSSRLGRGTSRDNSDIFQNSSHHRLDSAAGRGYTGPTLGGRRGNLNNRSASVSGAVGQQQSQQQLLSGVGPNGESVTMQRNQQLNQSSRGQNIGGTVATAVQQQRRKDMGSPRKDLGNLRNNTNQTKSSINDPNHNEQIHMNSNIRDGHGHVLGSDQQYARGPGSGLHGGPQSTNNMSNNFNHNDHVNQNETVPSYHAHFSKPQNQNNHNQNNNQQQSGSSSGNNQNYGGSDSSGHINHISAAEAEMASVEYTYATLGQIQRYVLRNVSSQDDIWCDVGEEAEVVTFIETLWTKLSISPRVSSICKLVPKFLKVFFAVVLEYATVEHIQELVPLLLLRFSRGLCPLVFYQASIHQLLIESLQKIFLRYPFLIHNLQKEIVKSIRSGIIAFDLGGLFLGTQYSFGNQTLGADFNAQQGPNFMMGNGMNMNDLSGRNMNLVNHNGNVAKFDQQYHHDVYGQGYHQNYQMNHNSVHDPHRMSMGSSYNSQYGPGPQQYNNSNSFLKQHQYQQQYLNTGQNFIGPGPPDMHHNPNFLASRVLTALSMKLKRESAYKNQMLVLHLCWLSGELNGGEIPQIFAALIHLLLYGSMRLELYLFGRILSPQEYFSAADANTANYQDIPGHMIKSNEQIYGENLEIYHLKRVIYPHRDTRLTKRDLHNLVRALAILISALSKVAIRVTERAPQVLSCFGRIHQLLERYDRATNNVAGGLAGTSSFINCQGANHSLIGPGQTVTVNGAVSQQQRLATGTMKVGSGSTIVTSGSTVNINDQNIDMNSSLNEPTSQNQIDSNTGVQENLNNTSTGANKSDDQKFDKNARATGAKSNLSNLNQDQNLKNVKQGQNSDYMMSQNYEDLDGDSQSDMIHNNFDYGIGQMPQIDDDNCINSPNFLDHGNFDGSVSESVSESNKFKVTVPQNHDNNISSVSPGHGINQTGDVEMDSATNMKTAAVIGTVVNERMAVSTSNINSNQDASSLSGQSNLNQNQQKQRQHHQNQKFQNLNHLNQSKLQPGPPPQQIHHLNQSQTLLPQPVEALPHYIRTSSPGPVLAYLSSRLIDALKLLRSNPSIAHALTMTSSSSDFALSHPSYGNLSINGPALHPFELA